MKRPYHILFLLLAVSAPHLLTAGEAVPQDTVRALPPDTTQVRGTVKRSTLEGPIDYEAQVIDNVMTERKTILTGRAQVTYLDMILKAAKITVEWDKDLMTAEGVWDSVWVLKTEPNGDGGDSVRVARLVGSPEFTEAGDVLTGEVMVFNFRTRKGRVLRGRTAFEDGFYSGQALKIVRENTLNVSDATFTTCDLEEDPHFHFRAKKMKIEVNKKVIAKPIVMYLGNIPVAALPFLYFPIQKGRQSGIVFPRYGESTLEGRYIRGLGYYWAASEYWDVQGTMDYFEKSGFLFRGDLRYNVRYKMSGGLSGSWTRKNFEAFETKERRWDLAVRHSQTLSPTMNLSVNGAFVSSGNFYKELSANREMRLQQQIRSNATLTKRFGGSKSVTVNFNQTRYLDTGNITETLPRISFRGGQSSLIPKPKAKPGQQIDTRWYHNIYISYNSRLERYRSKTMQPDSSFKESGITGWDHTARLSSSPKLFGWLSVSPGVNYTETWFDRRKLYTLNTETNAIEQTEEKGFFARRTFDFSTALSTKLYGMFQPRFLKKVILRHVMTPSVSFSYQPDFSDPRWGYYQAVEDTLGEVDEFDLYSGTNFGSTPSGGRQSMSFGLTNLFQMKIGEGEEEKKFDLFTYNLSTSYNWKSTQYKMSTVSSSFRAKPARPISLDFGMTHSFYQTDEDGNQIPRMYITDIRIKDPKSWFGRWLRLTAFRANMRIQLRGTAKTGGTGQATGDLPAASESMQDVAVLPGDRLTMDESVTGFNIPWNLSATLSYNESRYNPNNPSKKFWLRTNLDFNLTKRWKVSYRAQFDLLEKEAVSQDFVFYRDLHCWEARFVWTPSGRGKRFYFKINIKSAMLQDIKIEKGTGLSGFTGSAMQRIMY